VSAKGLLLTAEGVNAVQNALREQELDGWLLFDFHEQNPVARRLLDLEWTTRRGFVLIPPEGRPVALLHAIELSYWQHWPWDVRTYSGWRELETELARLVGAQGSRLAMEVSERSSVPTLDLVPSGMRDLIVSCGVSVVSSGNLVSRFYSTWSPEQLVRHREYAKTVEAVARAAFARAADAVRAGKPTHEGALAQWIRSELERRGVGVDHSCCVAVGPNAANPHYDPGPVGQPIEKGDLLLIDLWGKGAIGDVPADQTWMGYLGSELPTEMQEVWVAIRDARDRALEYLADAHREGREIRGLEVDDVCREVIVARGFGDAFIHRTGHSIDEHLHGSGPNLDNLETRDDRALIPGVGFSVEPGVYLTGRFGMRTEVDVFWGPDGPEVTTEEPQTEVFLLLAEE